MGYYIDYINKKNISLNEIVSFETNGFDIDHEYFISNDLKNKVKDEFINENLNFELHVNEGEMIFDFSVFEVAIYSNKVNVSISYDDYNRIEGASEVMFKVDRILEKLGFTGYDIQEEGIYKYQEGISRTFQDNLIQEKEVFIVNDNNERRVSSLVKGGIVIIILLGAILFLYREELGKQITPSEYLEREFDGVITTENNK